MKKTAQTIYIICFILMLIGLLAAIFLIPRQPEYEPLTWTIICAPIVVMLMTAGLRAMLLLNKYGLFYYCNALYVYSAFSPGFHEFISFCLMLSALFSAPVFALTSYGLCFFAIIYILICAVLPSAIRLANPSLAKKPAFAIDALIIILSVAGIVFFISWVYLNE